MAGIPDLIRSGVAMAKSLLADALVDVDHVMAVGRDLHGVVYADPVPRQALVEDVGEAIVDEGGNQRLATSKLTFLEPIPIDLMDKFVVNGAEMTVARRAGLLPPDDPRPYLSEVWVGRPGARGGSS